MSLWHRLTNPAESVRDPESRRRAQLLAALLLALIPLFTLVGLIQFITSDILLAYLGIAIILLVIAYGLSRTRYYRFGALFAFGVFTINPVIALLAQGDYSLQSLNNTIIWIVPTVVLGSLVLSLRSTIALIIGNIGIVLIVVKLVSGLSIWSVAYPLGFAATISILIVAAMIIRYQDLRRLEEQATRLARSEERFRSLFEAAFEGIAVHEGGFILDVNHAFETMFGYSASEAVGMALWDFCAETSRDSVRRHIHTEDEGPIEATGVRKDGSTFVLEMASKGHTYRGERVRVTALRDITERKQAEEAREKLIEELDAFAHTVAHDLKSPLNIILSYASLLESEHAAFSDEQLEEHLRSMAKSVRKMENIINELLLLSSARKAKVQSEPLDMARIVSEAQLRLSDMIRESGGRIVVPKTWPTVLGYGPWVEEVWVNYISNALKYGGRPPYVELGAALQPDGMVRFWVRDNGPGLTPEQRALVFIPFTRLSQVRAEGHGLGLSIVQRIVEKLGGQVGVESEVGQGSLFYFTLPAVQTVSS